MNIKKTLIITVIFIAIVGYYAWDQKRLSTKEAGEKIAGRLIKPESDALTGIVLENDGRTIAFKREDGQWLLSEPIQARTDKAAFGVLLNALDTTTRDDAFEPDGDLAEFGFGEDAIKVVVSADGENYSETLIIGEKTPDGGKVYARTESSEDVFTVPATVANTLAKSLLALRDKRLLPATITEATTMTLAFSGQTIEAVKRDGSWWLTQPKPRKGDANAISGLLKEWSKAQARDFIDTGSLTLDAYGLAEPFWTGTISLGDSEGEAAGPMTLLIGDMPSTDSVNRYAMIQGEPTIFQVQDRLLDTLRPSEDDLRDKVLFTMATDEVGRIVFEGRKSSIDLERDSAELWQFADSSDDRVNQAAVSRKLNELLALQANRFFDPAPTAMVTGLDRPFVNVTLYSKDGKTSEGVQTASSSEDNEFVYARNKTTDEVVGVDFRAPGNFMITRDDLLDRSMFEFDVELIKKVKLIDGETTLTLTQGATGRWMLDGGAVEKALPVEAGDVLNMLYSLTSMEWDRRLDPAYESDLTQIKTHGLENTPKSYILLDSDGAELARLGRGGESDRSAYVTVDSTRYYAIDKGRFGSFLISVEAVLAEMFTSESAE